MHKKRKTTTHQFNNYVIVDEIILLPKLCYPRGLQANKFKEKISEMLDL